MLCTQSYHAALAPQSRRSVRLAQCHVVKVVRDWLAAKASQNEAAQAKTTRQHL